MSKMRVVQPKYTVAVGKSIRIYCGDCQTEYEILHEPFYAASKEMREGFGGHSKLPGHCPFCGSDKDLDFHR